MHEGRRYRLAGLGLAAWLAAGCASLPDPEDAAPLPYSEAVAARFARPAVDYRTPAFAPGRSAYTSNEELAQALGRIVGSARGGIVVRRIELGRSHEGEPIEALHFASAGAAPKPRVLLIGQQHGDEPAPAEALLVVADELARGRLRGVLAAVDVIVLPRANPDGAAVGRRAGAHALDINRDHLLLRTPEAQALARAARDFTPALVVDVHEHTVVGRYLEKFGAVQRHDMLVQYATTANLPSALTQASETWFRAPLLAALRAEGLSAEWYYTTPTSLAARHLAMGGVQPDTGRNVYGLRNAVSLLLESRGVGIGRLHFTRRVHSQVVALRSLLTSAARHAPGLAALRAQADAEVAAAACRGDAVLHAEQTRERRNMLFIDPQTGADRALDVEWLSSLTLQPRLVRARPCAYWLAADATLAVERLRALGVQVEQLAAPTPLVAEAYREVQRAAGRRDDVRGSIADGDGIVRVQVALGPAERFDAPAGSYLVTLAQPLANLVLAALEPDTQNSYFAHRLLAQLAQVRRVR
jgi:hypothetical protein